MDSADPERGVPFTSNASPSLPSGSQVIVTSYQFSCYGTIYSWHTYVRESNESSTQRLQHDIYFQVWRPSSGVEQDGCYDLVGQNTFRNITAEGDGRISVTVQPSDVIDVSPGDVVGYYAESAISGEENNADVSYNNTTEIKLDETYGNESVWYHVNTDDNPLINSGGSSCVFPVGTDKILELRINAAPVMSLGMGKF